MTATEAWFFAELRTIAGPPMSICSMRQSGTRAGSYRRSERIEVADQQIERSTPSSVICAMRRQPQVGEQTGMDHGCKVLTRPSRHSGNPVTFSIGVTGRPASAIVSAVEPVETICPSLDQSICHHE